MVLIPLNHFGLWTVQTRKYYCDWWCQQLYDTLYMFLAVWCKASTDCFIFNGAHTVPKRNLLPASLVLEKLAAPRSLQKWPISFQRDKTTHPPREGARVNLFRQRRKIVLVKTLWSIASTRRQERITRSWKSHRSSFSFLLFLWKYYRKLTIFSLKSFENTSSLAEIC